MSITRRRKRPSCTSSDFGPSRRRVAIASGLATAALVVSSVSIADAGRRGNGGQSELAEVRRANAQFRNVARAERDGHQLGWKDPFPIDGCVEHPTDGAMGYHWFDHDAIEDIALDPLEPEAFVYEPRSNGKLRLVAVEWVVPADAWHAAGNVEPPALFGQEFSILNPALGWYVLHAWLWKPNPSGMFANWNPDVVCP